MVVSFTSQKDQHASVTRKYHMNLQFREKGCRNAVLYGIPSYAKLDPTFELISSLQGFSR